MKVILGFSGLMASGKGTAAKYLEEAHGAKTFRFSTMLRDLLDRLYLPHTRDNLVKISEALRAAFGEGLLAKTMARDVENENAELVVVEGIRRMADLEHLKTMPNFVLVEIFAEARLRHARMNARGENLDDTAKTFAQFIKDHERSTEQSIPDVLAHATERVDNNGSLERLREQLDALVKKYVKR